MATVTPFYRPKPCPICRRPSLQPFHPFCSDRCRDIDLNRWLSGAYVIPARDDEAEDEDDAATPTTPGDDE
jgi:endogenous inhibitor of DNA gyrase (YacG/DUF329 family)